MSVNKFKEQTMESNISEVVPRFFLTRNLIDCQKIDAKIVKLYIDGRKKNMRIYSQSTSPQFGLHTKKEESGGRPDWLSMICTLDVL